MPTIAAVQILQICLNITSSTFAFHPIQIKRLDSKYHVFKAKLSWKAHLFWITISALSLTVTVLEFFLSFQHQLKNFFVIFYHAFLLLAKLSAILCIFVFNQNSNGLTQLLCHYFQYPQSSVLTINEPKRSLHSKRGNKFTYFLATLVILFALFFIAFFPIVTFMVPRLHPVLLIVPVTCNNLAVRSTAFIIQILMLAPTCGGNCLVISACLVIVNEMFSNLDKFW